MFLDTQPEWQITDSSKLSDFVDCPRQYFFKHILGWQSDAPNNHLIFGTAIHKAMEVMALSTSYNQEAVENAYAAFLKEYRKDFPVESDEIYSPKNPQHAEAILFEYADKYRNDLQEFKVIYTEIAGTVPVSKDRLMHFRMDTICEEEQGPFSLEHKTHKGSLTEYWYRQWPLSMAIGTYSHAMHCLYPNAEKVGVTMNGLGYLKTKSDLQRFPIYKTLPQMQTWLWNVNYHLDDLEHQMELLDNCSDSDSVLMAFPMRSGTCSKYFGCPFLDFCQAWQNPLQQADEPPMGFKREFWNPSILESTHKMNL